MKRTILLVLIVIVSVYLANAATLEYDETDLVSLKASATDQDDDKLVYSYSSPLDTDGKWQTDYGDAGEYTVTVTVSDEELSSSQEVLIVINKKEIAPTVSSFNPVEKSLAVDEGGRLEFSIEAIDRNKDELSYQWKVAGSNAGRGESFVYSPSYDDAGLRKIEVIISDGELSASNSWTVDVQNVDRSSILNQIEDIEIEETQVASLELPDFSVFGLSYTISEPIGSDNTWETGYDDAGVHTARVTITDGSFSDSKDVKVTVRNKDRALSFQAIENAVLKENQKVVINLAATDPDNEAIVYSAENMPLGASLEGNVFSWQPDYDTVKKDNFVYDVMDKLRILRKGFSVEFTAKSGEVEITRNVKITVLDVNRAPVIEALSTISVLEGEKLNISASVSDPDGDKVDIKYGGFIESNYYLIDYDDSGEYSVTIIASDGKTKTIKEVMVEIIDVNRAPKFNEIPDREIIEEGLIKVKIDAYDPDGDMLTFSSNMGEVEDGVFIWEPGFDVVSGTEKKDITVEFLVSDGEFNISKEMIITVYNVNKKPEIINAGPSPNIIAFKDNPVLFSVDAEDKDNDELHYSWNFGFFEKYSDGGKHRRTFTTLGDKKVEVTVTDGFEEESYVWNVKVIDFEEYKKIVG